ncbi:MAG TPA: phosphopantetheine-binding protein [Candidatus Nitrosotenuis sp.]|nr:phosphopantetheine-binding protein [Candidatus Nitrosotenuis sp.]
MTRREIETRVKNAVLQTSQFRPKLKPSHRFIADLGFDSLRMVALSLALESEFGQPLLLNEWLSSAEDVTQLTVGSLCDYVAQVVPDGG